MKAGEQTFPRIQFKAPEESKARTPHIDWAIQSVELVIGLASFHRSYSGADGSIVINQAIRDSEFDPETEFIPVSAAKDKDLYHILAHEKPVIHTLGE